MNKEAKKIGEIALIFMAFRDQLKIYHWQTPLYSRHKSSDKLVDKITEKMDLFIETLQGSRGVRLSLPDDNTIDFSNNTDNSIVQLLKAFIGWLNNNLTPYLDDLDTDLLNIKDEILAKCNQTLYLFTFN